MHLTKKWLQRRPRHLASVREGVEEGSPMHATLHFALFNTCIQRNPDFLNFQGSQKYGYKKLESLRNRGKITVFD